MNRFTQFIGFLIFGLSVTVSHAVSENDELWKILQTQTNLVVLMRHAHPDIDSGNPLHWDKTGKCKNERMISDEGREFAKRIGRLFAKKNIKPFVISSPMCRTVETAKLAFGETYITDPALREIASATKEKYQSFVDKSQELLIAYRGKHPVVFISHRPNVEALSFELISVTELIVGSIDDDGEIEVIGILKP